MGETARVGAPALRAQRYFRDDIGREAAVRQSVWSAGLDGCFVKMQPYRHSRCGLRRQAPPGLLAAFCSCAWQAYMTGCTQL
jgi:hypothetical protein